MSATDFKKIPPSTIYEFREIHHGSDIEIPEPPENRKCTDVFCLILYTVSLMALGTLLIYSAVSNSNLRRFIHGYDHCGDTCGSTNKPNSVAKCSGKDLTDKNYLVYKFITIEDEIKDKTKNVTKVVAVTCVEKCPPGFLKVFYGCYPMDDKKFIVDVTDFAEDIASGLFHIILPMMITGLVFCLLFYMLLYCNATCTIFLVVIVSLVFVFTATGISWYYYAKTKSNDILAAAIFFTIYLVLLAIFVCCVACNYRQISVLFHEAVSAVFNTPALLFLPWAVAFVIAISTGIATFFFILLSTNATLQQSDYDKSVYEYHLTTVAIVAIFFLSVMVLWGSFIIEASQVVIVAIPVSSYYFQEDPEDRYGLCKSCHILFRYHLGSVIFGSFLITLLTIARAVIHGLQNENTEWWAALLAIICNCCQEIVEYLARRAYVQIGLHGKSLFRSGQRAIRLLWANLMDTIKLDIFGNFILVCAGSIIVGMTVGVAYIAHHLIWMTLMNKEKYVYFWGVVAVGAVITSGITYLCLSVITLAVTTIFMCYCEDNAINDGRHRPYVMPESIDNLVDEAKRKRSQGRRRSS